MTNHTWTYKHQIQFAIGLCVALFASTGVASARIVTGVTATASSEIDLSEFGNFPRSPMFVVDGSGMEPGGDNSAVTADQRSYSHNGDFYNWLSSHVVYGGVDEAPWFLVDLGAVYEILGVRIFNYAENGGAFDQSGLGVRHADILISTDGIDFTPLATNFEITQAIVTDPELPQPNGSHSYNDYGTYYTISDFTGDEEQTQTSFRYMRFDIFSNWYENNTAYGLAELQFETIGLPGDFNNDGFVNAADYVVWRDNPTVGSYEEWQSNFGSAPGSGSGLEVGGGSSVPEPGAALLAIAGGMGLFISRRSRSVRRS